LPAAPRTIPTVILTYSLVNEERQKIIIMQENKTHQAITIKLRKMKMPVADTSANAAHKATALASEMTRQSDVAKAIAAGGSSAVVQAAINVAEKAHYARLTASALANNIDSAVFVQAGNWVGTHA
jgi:glycerate-2-kinase